MYYDQQGGPMQPPMQGTQKQEYYSQEYYNKQGSNQGYGQQGSNQNDQNPDWQVTMRVKKAIMGDNTLSAKSRMVSVSTNNGVVTLTGNVMSYDESNRIEQIVRNIPGVMDVDNQITVGK